MTANPDFKVMNISETAKDTAMDAIEDE